MRYFQLTLNHFICAVLSKFTILMNVWILISSVSLFSISVGLFETNFREYSKSDFIVWASSLYSLPIWTPVIVHLNTTGLSSKYSLQSVFSEHESRIMINIYWVQLDHTSTS